MDHRWILTVPEYYARLNSYLLGPFAMGPEEQSQDRDEWIASLRGILGESVGRSVLDCSCGWGTQTVPLAMLGWQVTACDISATSMESARRYAKEEGVSVEFRLCDMRDLAQVFDRQFDWAVSCYALYEIPDEEDLHQAARGMFGALKPGGKCYLHLRDMDELMEDQPRHVFLGERRLSNGRVLWIQDWDFESETQVVALDAFLSENEDLDPSDHFRWTTETIGVRKRVLYKAELQSLLDSAGFNPVTFLPKPVPWANVEVVATRPE